MTSVIIVMIIASILQEKKLKWNCLMERMIFVFCLNTSHIDTMVKRKPTTEHNKMPGSARATRVP